MKFLGSQKQTTIIIKEEERNKCVVFRSAMVVVALNASVSSEGINSRQKILLNEA